METAGAEMRRIGSYQLRFVQPMLKSWTKWAVFRRGRNQHGRAWLSAAATIRPSRENTTSTT